MAGKTAMLVPLHTPCNTVIGELLEASKALKLSVGQAGADGHPDYPQHLHLVQRGGIN